MIHPRPSCRHWIPRSPKKGSGKHGPFFCGHVAEELLSLCIRLTQSSPRRKTRYCLCSIALKTAKFAACRCRQQFDQQRQNHCVFADSDDMRRYYAVVSLNERPESFGLVSGPVSPHPTIVTETRLGPPSDRKLRNLSVSVSSIHY